MGTIASPNPAVHRLEDFNLHGLVDAPEWYGQRDPNSSDAARRRRLKAMDYPVAVRPADVLNSGRAPTGRVHRGLLWG